MVCQGVQRDAHSDLVQFVQSHPGPLGSSSLKANLHVSRGGARFAFELRLGISNIRGVRVRGRFRHPLYSGYRQPPMIRCEESDEAVAQVTW